MYLYKLHECIRIYCIYAYMCMYKYICIDEYIYIYMYTLFFKEVEVDGKTTSWKNSSQERSTALSTEEMALTADQRAETWRKRDLR